MQARRGLADEIDWRVYFVTDTTYCGGLSNVPAVVEAAICGGAGVVQIRDKEIDDPTFLRAFAILPLKRLKVRQK